MAFVLDCFVATAWTFADEATDATNRLREALVDAPAFVPALWPVETANETQARLVRPATFTGPLPRCERGGR